jgi:DNA-binding NarL/FixJ family response regulator
MRAIREVLANKVYLSARMTSQLLQRMAGKHAPLERSGMELLSDRELEVFQRIGQGRNTREIAEELHLGESTVDTYRARIKEKLGLKNVAELYHRATEWVNEQQAGGA